MQSLVKKVYSSKRLSSFFQVSSLLIEIIVSVSFCLQLVFTFFGDVVIALKVAVSAAVGLVMVSILRKLINAPRPYEIYDFFEAPPRKGSGCSFPSRHAYSSFVIAVLAWLWHPAISISLLALALCLCVLRVLLGIHFVRDVICGAAIGIIAAVIGILTVVL